jgi:hypothetical protein
MFVAVKDNRFLLAAFNFKWRNLILATSIFSGGLGPLLAR